jgi:hypothetical protein
MMTGGGETQRRCLKKQVGAALKAGGAGVTARTTISSYAWTMQAKHVHRAQNSRFAGATIEERFLVTDQPTYTPSLAKPTCKLVELEFCIPQPRVETEAHPSAPSSSTIAAAAAAVPVLLLLLLLLLAWHDPVVCS